MMHLRADTQVGPYDIRSAFAAGDRKGRPYANARPYKSQFTITSKKGLAANRESFDIRLDLIT